MRADQTALILANGNFGNIHGKTAHGLIRRSRRFTIVGVVDPEFAGRDAGEVLDGRRRGIPIFASLADALGRGLPATPRFCVVGIATHGGKLTEELRALLREAVGAGMSIVNGLHEFAGDDPSIADLARKKGVTIVDVRRPKPKDELHFWKGAVYSCRAPRIAALGMDCAIGKRTTAALLVDALNAHGIRAEMIYTGQTGWMQGADYGFVLDSVFNDFVPGELEHAIVSCDRDRSPDVIVIEGQSALRNPCGPCGAELLLSGACRGAILQHAPARVYFEGYEDAGLRIPPVGEEVKLIAAYGTRTLAVTLNVTDLPRAEIERTKRGLAAELKIPVVEPLREIERLLPTIIEYIEAERTSPGGGARREGHP